MQRKVISGVNLAARTLALIFSGNLCVPLPAALLKPEALAAWEDYQSHTRARTATEAHDSASFVKSIRNPALKSRLREGEIVVHPVSSNGRVKVSSALIHDWEGFMFVPNVTMSDFLSRMRDVESFPRVYKPSISQAKVMRRSDSSLSYRMTMRESVALLDLSLQGDFQSVFHRVDDKNWYEETSGSHLQIIKNAGKKNEKVGAEDDGNGFLWRVLAISRYRESDGGIYVELRTLSLSRNIPGILAPVVDPIVARVSREALQATLRKTRDAMPKSGQPAETSQQAMLSAGH